MSLVQVNLNIYAEPISKPINKFYPYWVYVNTPQPISACKKLENVIKEMQNANTKVL